MNLSKVTILNFFILALFISNASFNKLKRDHINIATASSSSSSSSSSLRKSFRLILSECKKIQNRNHCNRFIDSLLFELPDNFNNIIPVEDKVYYFFSFILMIK